MSLRPVSIRRTLARLIVAAAALAAIAFFMAPAVAFLGVRAAAEAQDVQGLTRLIDFPAVRASLRPQLDERPQMQRPTPSFLDDPLGAIRRQFDQATAPPGPRADDYLTPAALAALTRGEGRKAIRWSGDTPPTQAMRKSGLASPLFWSINRARLGVRGDDRSVTSFTFERRGAYQWKLVHIGLPPERTVSGGQP